MTSPMFIDEADLSVAWSRAFLRAMEPGVEGVTPLMINLTGFDDGDPKETPAIREALDATLRRLRWALPRKKGKNLYESQTNANLICPYCWYERAPDRHAFFGRFREFYPRLRRCNRLNVYGTYFGRMVAYGRGPEGGNQLEHILKNYLERGISRPTAMVADVFDAARDHTAQRRRGFPCLNKVTFVVCGKDRDELAVVADYPAQNLFERAYGNYLGLCRLGKFMAREMNLKLTRLTCTVGYARLGEVGKLHLSVLRDLIRTDPAVQAAIARTAPLETRGGHALAG